MGRRSQIHALVPPTSRPALPAGVRITGLSKIKAQTVKTPCHPHCLGPDGELAGLAPSLSQAGGEAGCVCGRPSPCKSFHSARLSPSLQARGALAANLQGASPVVTPQHRALPDLARDSGRPTGAQNIHFCLIRQIIRKGWGLASCVIQAALHFLPDMPQATGHTPQGSFPCCKEGSPPPHTKRSSKGV